MPDGAAVVPVTAIRPATGPRRGDVARPAWATPRLDGLEQHQARRSSDAATEYVLPCRREAHRRCAGDDARCPSVIERSLAGARCGTTQGSVSAGSEAPTRNQANTDHERQGRRTRRRPTPRARDHLRSEDDTGQRPSRRRATASSKAVIVRATSSSPCTVERKSFSCAFTTPASSRWLVKAAANRWSAASALR